MGNWVKLRETNWEKYGCDKCGVVEYLLCG